MVSLVHFDEFLGLSSILVSESFAELVPRIVVVLMVVWSNVLISAFIHLFSEGLRFYHEKLGEFYLLFDGLGLLKLLFIQITHHVWVPVILLVFICHCVS